MFQELILVFIALILFLSWKGTGKSSKNHPPGPYRLPIIGSVLSVATLKKLPPYYMFHELTKKYGPVTFLKLGAINQILLEDYDLIKEVLTSELWVNRHYTDWMSLRSFKKVLGVLLVSGPNWKEMRRFSIRTLRDFGFGKQKSMDMSIQDELIDLSKRIREKFGEDKKEAVVKIQHLFTPSVLNVLWNMIAGFRFCYDDAKLVEFISLMDKEMKANTLGDLEKPVYLFSAFPILGKILPLFINYEMGAVFKLQDFFRNILEERRALGYFRDEQKDFVDVFLKQIEDNKHLTASNKENFYTDEQFMTVVLDLFMAGSETTSNTMEFAISYLLRNPEAYKKVQAEIDKVIGHDRYPSILDKQSMPFTEAFLLETQRMANVVPIDVRSPIKDVVFNGYHIKEGTLAVINLYSMHMNEKQWKNPYAFNPQRFLDSDNKVINADKILPFGAGRRVCIGETLARTSLFIFFTTLLQQFSLEISPEHPLPDGEPVLGFTLSPKPYYALFKERLIK